jgi:hypothetical protein
VIEKRVENALVELGRGAEVGLHARRKAPHGVASSRNHDVSSSCVEG